MKDNLILIGSKGYVGSLLSKELSKTYNIIYQETGDWSPKKIMEVKHQYFTLETFLHRIM
jgi:hypothetical protein